MPQTPVEKKFCSLSANHWLQNLASINSKKLGIAKFQSLNKILAVGENPSGWEKDSGPREKESSEFLSPLTFNPLPKKSAGGVE